MGLRRFISKGVTIKRIINLHPIKNMKRGAILPVYLLIIYSNKSNCLIIRLIYFIFSNIFRVFANNTSTFESLLKSNVKNKIISRSLLKQYFSQPTFINDNLVTRLVEFSSPKEFTIACLANIKIAGSSSVIIYNKHDVFYENATFDLENKILYESEFRIYYSKANQFIVEDRKATKCIENGIWLGGTYSFNFYHFLFEYLVKFPYLSTASIPDDIPIIVDYVNYDLPIFKKLIDLFNDQNRKIITIDYSENVFVNTLYYVSCPNYLPLNLKEIHKIRSYDYLFDIKSLINLRSKLLPLKGHIITPKRFFITRKNSSGKRPFNENEVFETLKMFGFECIAPEEYLLEDQIALFNNAEIIVGGSGAAFSNLLYCNDKCKVIILQKYKIYYSGFSTIAATFNVKLIYLTEESNFSNNIKELHESFVVDNLMLRNALLKLL
jgi:capsular polysaccharide biosynthesis protein